MIALLALELVWQVVPTLVAMVSFLSYVVFTNRPISLSTGFTALLLFNLLATPLQGVPEMYGVIIRARISLKRIEMFLSADEVPGLPLLELNEISMGSIQVFNASASWKSPKNVTFESKPLNHNWFKNRIMNSMKRIRSRSQMLLRHISSNTSGHHSKIYCNVDVDGGLPIATLKPQSLPSFPTIADWKSQAILSSVSFSIKPNSLVAIVGVTGSGKTTLIEGLLLGQAGLISGQRHINGSISFSSQAAWLQNATIKENILFGSDYDEERYRDIVFACALDKDFNGFPRGDLSEIGEKGMNLSGGQQQRISLARAAFRESNIILFDDPLSALDPKTAKFVFK